MTMAHCVICGDSDRDDPISAPVRFWSPDDGWMVGRFCHYCKPLAKVKPKPDDFAYDKRGEYFADEQDAIDQICG
jgi:hypothetical protein